VYALDGGKQVGRERSYAAFARQMVTNKSDLTDFRRAVHEGIPLLVAAWHRFDESVPSTEIAKL
jgi:hypothetical protein